MESDNRKFTLLSFFLAACLVGYIFYLFITQVADWFKIAGGRVLFGYTWPVVGGTAAVLFALILFIGFSMNNKSTTFIDEVFSELRKTTWPTPDETFKSTIAVSIMCAIAAGMLWFLDSIWNFIFQNLLY